jgi:hypothetical protein
VSSVDRAEIGAVQSQKTVVTGGVSSTTVVSRFGYTERSSTRMLPLVLVNMRLVEPNEHASLQLSAGAAVDAAGNTGTRIEHIIGGTVAFKREVFLTCGWHFAYTSVLAGGFKLDKDVPQAVSAPPLEVRRDSGLMLALTFQLR